MAGKLGHSPACWSQSRQLPGGGGAFAAGGEEKSAGPGNGGPGCPREGREPEDSVSPRDPHGSSRTSQSPRQEPSSQTVVDGAGVTRTQTHKVQEQRSSPSPGTPQGAGHKPMPPGRGTRGTGPTQMPRNLTGPWIQTEPPGSGVASGVPGSPRQPRVRTCPCSAMASGQEGSCTIPHAPEHRSPVSSLPPQRPSEPALAMTPNPCRQSPHPLPAHHPGRLLLSPMWSPGRV